MREAAHAPPADGIDVDFLALQGALAGQFSLGRLLGRGGMGVVYLAREVELDRPVALKVLPPALAAQAEVRERFLREARTAARLSHPNIVPIHRVDEVAGFVFFAMAYVDGPTLEAEVRRRGALPPMEVARIVRDVGWALAYAHARGVVHRDVKPENILLDRAAGRALVTDFGIAQVAGSAAGMPPGLVIGTPYFMSPEHAAGQPVDGRSDLYALGVVAYYTLTGRLPFTGPPETVLAKQVTDPPPPLVALNPAIPPALAEAVHRALAKSPDDRYENAETFAEAVALSLAHRDEVPLPLALWLASGGEMRYLLAAVLGAAGLAVAHRVRWTEWAAFAVLTSGSFAVLALGDVRRLLAAGFQLDDLRRALREHAAHIAQPPHADPPPRSALETALGARRRTLGRGVGVVIAGLAALGGLAALARPGGTLRELVAMGVVMLAGVLCGGWLGHGWAVAWRAWLWSGRPGTVLARLAAWRLRSDDTDQWAVPWSAEVLLGRATQDLFAALPATARGELRELPDAVRRLERTAAGLRRRIEELSRVLATLEDEGGLDDNVHSPGGEGRRTQAADVRAERDVIGRQLASAVSALESIRLAILRLQADASSVGRLAAVLDAVAPGHRPAAWAARDQSDVP